MVELRPLDGGRETDPGAGVVAAVEALAAGRLVVLLDDEGSHLVAAGRLATTQGMATMAAYGRGVFGVAMPALRLAELEIAPLAEKGYHAPVDLAGQNLARGHAGRAATVRALADSATTKADLESPGQVFPIAVEAGGVLARAGFAEAAADLARIACGDSVAVHVAAADEGGAPADVAAGGRLARTLGLRVVSVAELIAYRERVECMVERLVAATLPTRQAEMTAIAFRSRRDRREYTALVHGDPVRRRVRVHVHLSCNPGDVFGGAACGCSACLRGALAEIIAAGSGVVIHTAHPDPFRHLKGLPPDSSPVVEADVAHLLRALDVREAIVTCNEPLDRRQMRIGGLRTFAPDPSCEAEAGGRFDQARRSATG